MKMIFRIALVGAFMFAGLAIASPASAYHCCNFHGDDYSETLGIANDIGQACDRETDGNGVFGAFVLNQGSQGDVPDGNGSASPCGIGDWTQTPYWIVRYKTYERNVTSGQAWTIVS